MRGRGLGVWIAQQGEQGSHPVKIEGRHVVAQFLLLLVVGLAQEVCEGLFIPTEGLLGLDCRNLGGGALSTIFTSIFFDLCHWAHHTNKTVGI